MAVRSCKAGAVSALIKLKAQPEQTIILFDKAISVLLILFNVVTFVLLNTFSQDGSEDNL